jgi:Carboxypeptidase regulatory-like domain
LSRSSIRKAIFITFLSFLAPLWGTAAFGQESINNASIGGRVADASGAAIDNAQVSARQIDTNVTTTIDTDRDGRFRFPYLKVGPYELKVHK